MAMRTFGMLWRLFKVLVTSDEVFYVVISRPRRPLMGEEWMMGYHGWAPSLGEGTIRAVAMAAGDEFAKITGTLGKRV